MDSQIFSNPLVAMVARTKIQDCLVRYCRGIDRCDPDLIKSAYWPDATDMHGIFNGNAHAFADFIVPRIEAMARTGHMIMNTSYEFETKNAARVETYVLSYSERNTASGHEDLLQGGRYLDRFQARSGEWRILDRVYVLDWTKHGNSPDQWDDPRYAVFKFRGGRRAEDPWSKGEPSTRGPR